MSNPRILVTGSAGQIGSELLLALRDRYGSNNVVAGYRETPLTGDLVHGPSERVDVTDKNRMEEVIQSHGINQVYHLAALLSAIAEEKPELAKKVNEGGFENVLQLAAKHDLRVFWASSMAVYGSDAPRENTPEDAPLNPEFEYGRNKVVGEKMANEHGVDVRIIRFPGIISHKTLPVGGTTDYAVHIYAEALKNGKFTHYLADGTLMPMQYMPDSLEAIFGIMEADAHKLSQRIYNVGGMSFAPEHITAEIREHIPLSVVTVIDQTRQAIADSWPNSLDDSRARSDWSYNPKFDLEKMTVDMLKNLRKKLGL